MRIIYGVSGEGSGHSSRAKAMASHLQEQGHEIRIVSYDRGYRTLHTYFGSLEVSGLHIISVDNKVSMPRTIWDNLRRLPEFRRSVGKLKQLFDEFRPDLVITDFEPLTAYAAKSRKLPLISLDNQHRMRYMHYDSPPRLRFDRWVTEMVIRMMVPVPDVALASTFFQGKVKNDRTFLFPPILRSEMGELTPVSGDHHLVYVTCGYDTLVSVLRQFPDERFVIYGYNREQLDGNLHYREFSTRGFLEDLASSRSVIATAGFTLISEAMYLQKPYLAFPMHGQFEQQLNGLCLEELGYGMNAGAADYATLSEFLSSVPRFAEALQHYADGFSNNPQACQNLAIRERLDMLLANEGAVLREFHQRH